MKEKLFEEDPSPENRTILQQAPAKQKKYLLYEEEFWRQKAGYKWFSKYDGNTRLFDNLVKGRRHRFQIKRIQDSDSYWLKEEDLMATEAIRFYQNQFSQEEENFDFSILNHVPVLIYEDDNERLSISLDLEEVKNVVFNLKRESSYGPGGMLGIFYQVCWEIVRKDVWELVKAFFEGNTLPKAITHTNLVFLPKKANPQNFVDLRPISLGNFINKVISGVVHDRLEKLLPKIISSNQSGFVKGRCIIENVLTQKINTDIRKRGKPANVVIQLDMDKAYDRVSWLFLTKVLRKLGFSEVFIELIWRLSSNNQYSIMLNGETHGFFHSTRGFKQGNPLSPALFIISAEVLSRALNNLLDRDNIQNFRLPKWSAKLNHLAYADDTIIFASVERTFLR